MKQGPIAVIAASVIGGSLTWFAQVAWANPYVLVVLPTAGGITAIYFAFTRKERAIARQALKQIEDSQKAALKESQLEAAFYNRKRQLALCPVCCKLPEVSLGHRVWHVTCCGFHACALKLSDAKKEWNKYFGYDESGFTP